MQPAQHTKPAGKSWGAEEKEKELMLKGWINRVGAGIHSLYVCFSGTFTKGYRYHGRSYQEIVLEQKLEKKRLDMEYLKYQLAVVRADNSELQNWRLSFKNAFADILAKTNEELELTGELRVQRTESGLDWEVVTEQCCLGGCDMGVYRFCEERDALLFAALLESVGYKVPHDMACPECYEAHMKEAA